MPPKPDPRHFYLNEQHELTREAQEGGGSLMKLAPIDWAAKQEVITTSLARTKQTILASEDPTRGQRYFLLARPETTIRKKSDDPKKAPEGVYDEKVDYAGKDAKALGRLGLDVLGITDQGAVVHATAEKFERLQTISSALQEVGRTEQSRWAMLSSFDIVPAVLRADDLWLNSLQSGFGGIACPRCFDDLSSSEIDDPVLRVGVALHGTWQSAALS